MGKATEYRPDIDGLRAVAILLVVAYHSGLVGRFGGFVGVDVFFVISGFLITGIVDRETRAGTFSFASFYERRLRRIGPALAATLAVFAGASYFLLVPMDLRDFGSSLAASVLFYANCLFYEHVGYFDGPAIEKPLLHTWSLAVEEQYYLIWPAMFVLFERFGNRAWRTYAMTALLLLSLGASEAMLAVNPAAAFYLLPSRMWELLLGGLIAVAPPAPASRPLSWPLGALGFGAIAYAALTFTDQTPFPGLNGLYPCLGAALLIVAGRDVRAPSRIALGWAPMRFVGKISYSLYLIHWPLLSLGTLAANGELGAPGRLALVAASFAAAALSWRFVETPARRAAVSRPKLAAGFAAAALTLTAAAIVFHATGGLPFRAPQAMQSAMGAAQLSHDECAAGPDRSSLTNPCPVGAKAEGGQYDFLVWGDSHALNLVAAVSGQAAARGLSGMILSTPACPPFLRDERLSAPCREVNSKVAAWVKSQTRLKAVYLAGYWTWTGYGIEAKGRHAASAMEYSGATPADGTMRLSATLGFLREMGIKTVVVEDVPAYPRRPTLCAERAAMFGRPIDPCVTLARSQYERDSALEIRGLRDLQQRFGFTLVNTADVFCGAQFCRATKDGAFLYYDTNHLSRAGSALLGAKVDLLAPVDGG